MNGAIIGLGHGERVILKAFKLAKIKILGVYSKNLSKSYKYFIKKKLKKHYLTVDELINDKEVDIVAIAVPAYYQTDLIKKCLIQNKHIFSEKPLTTNYKKIKKLYSKLQISKKKFIADYIFQNHKAFKKFKNLLPNKIFEEAKINIIFKTQSYVNKNKIRNWKNNPILGGGIINLYLPHIIQYLIFFFGPILYCKKIIKNSNSVKINYFLKSGITAYVNICSNETKREHSISYEDKKTKLILKNNTRDYAKGFKIKKTDKIKGKNKIILYNNRINSFKGDGRILLSYDLIKLFFSKFDINEHQKKIKEYMLIESILDETRKLV